jgi:signal transduction protein with GAF and PtsI domain
MNALLIYLKQVKKYLTHFGVPVMYRRKVMGVLVVQNKEPQDFSEAAESFSSLYVRSSQG